MSRYIGPSTTNSMGPPRAWIVPNQIKKFDGLNAVNAIMTAIKFGACKGERKYIDSLWAILLGQVRNWPNVMWEGVPDDDVPRLLDFAVKWYNETPLRAGELPNLKVDKIEDVPNITMQASLNYIAERLKKEVSFALVRTDVPWPHWFVVHYIMGYKFYGIDDYGVVSGEQLAGKFKSFLDDVDVKSINPKRFFDVDHVYRITRVAPR